MLIVVFNLLYHIPEFKKNIFLRFQCYKLMIAI